MNILRVEEECYKAFTVASEEPIEKFEKKGNFVSLSEIEIIVRNNEHHNKV